MSLQSLTAGWSLTLERPTISQDSSGGPVRAPFVAVLPNIAGSLQPAGSNTVLAYAQRQVRVTHQFYTARDIGAKVGYRLTIASTPPRVFVVKGYGNEAGWNRVWVTDVEEQLNGVQ